MKIVFCRACGKGIPEKAKTCPFCGAKNKKSFMGRFLLVIIIGVIAVIYMIHKQYLTINLKIPYIDIINLSTSTAVSAGQLTSDYNTNEVRADGLYKGKLLEVRGIVREVGKDSRDGPYITFDTDWTMFMFLRAYCKTSEETKLARLSKGQTVTIIGTCLGKNIIYVDIKDCLLE
jgi:hypothetical protein